MELSETDAGAEHPLGVGQEAVLRLPENRTTGYRWQLSAPDGVEVEDAGYEPAPSGVPGAPGTRTFRLRPAVPGPTGRRRPAAELGVLRPRRRRTPVLPADDGLSAPAGDDVRVVDVAPRATAVVAATTTWPDFPTVWGSLLDEVWAWLGAGGITGGCRNIMLYLDDAPSVEVGVLLEFPPAVRAARRVRATRGPGGDDRSPWILRGAPDAHEAVLGWCAGADCGPPVCAGRSTGRTRRPGPQWTEVSCLLPPS